MIVLLLYGHYKRRTHEEKEQGNKNKRKKNTHESELYGQRI